MLFHRDAHVPNHDDRFIQPSDPAMGSASDSPAMIVQRRRMSTDHFHSIATAPTQSVTTPDRVRQRLFADIGELPATPVAALNLRDDRVSVMANMAPDAEHSGDHVKFEHAVDTMNDHSMDVDIGHGHDDDYSTPDTQLASQHKENCYSITTFPPSTGTSATHSDSPLVTVAREQKRRMRNALESLPLVVPAVSKRTPRPVLRDGPTSTVSTASLFVTPPRAQLAFRGVMNGEVAQSRVGTAATVATLDTPNLLKHGMEFDQQNFIERALAWQQPEWKVCSM